MKRGGPSLLPVPVDGELKDLVKEASLKTHLSQAAVMRSALRIGVPEVVKRLGGRPKPRRNLVEYLDAFAGLVKRDTQKIEALRLG
jgi:hypothetical protein